MSNTVIYEKGFTVKDGKSNYKFQLNKGNRPWIWILLAILLLLLLLVRCEREITVSTVDSVNGSAVPDVTVELSYKEHFIYKEGRLFGSDLIHRNQTTDGEGLTTFSKLPCSVFSYIFCCMTKAQYAIKSTCYTLKDDVITANFHYTSNVELPITPNVIDLDWIVVDKDTNDPIAGALIEYGYIISGTRHTDSVRTNGAGECVLRNVPECGELTLNLVSCYGYKDTLNIVHEVPDVTDGSSDAKTYLEPLKTSFTFFVINKHTSQPIPEATVEVTLKSGTNVMRGRAVTNVDGRGRGAYKDAFVLANVSMKGSKVHYRDGMFEYVTPRGAKHTYCRVDTFIKLPDDKRVIKLEPEPYVSEFQNVDSINGSPIAGVKNEIRIKGIDGSNTEGTEISNRNGVFPVLAREGDKINIHSTHKYYEDKDTYIASYSTGKKIPMRPKTTSITFRTIDAETGDVLPDCSLRVSTTRSNVHTPTNSGPGVFTVDNLYVYENLTIIASKPEYGSNDTKVNNDPVAELMTADQERRDIPLRVALPPCNADGQGQNNVAAGNVSPPQSYNMGKKQGTFKITYDTGSTCSDCIDIYNHEPGQLYTEGVKVFSSGQVSTDGEVTRTVNFAKGSVITIIVTTGPKDGSLWNYHINCPE